MARLSQSEFFVKSVMLTYYCEGMPGQGSYCNNLENWVTEIFEVDMTSMMVGRQFKPWAHSRKFFVVT